MTTDSGSNTAATSLATSAAPGAQRRASARTATADEFRRGAGDLRQLRVLLPLTVRLAREEDLAGLEWYGLLTRQRALIREAFERQQHGSNLMLLACRGDAPVAQVWVELDRYREDAAGLLWAVRVFPALQGLGIGSRLIAAAEHELVKRDRRWSVIGVERDDDGACRLYERLGYQRLQPVYEEYEYTTPEGIRHRVPVDQWLYGKALGPGRHARPAAPALGPAGGTSVPRCHDRRQRDD